MADRHTGIAARELCLALPAVEEVQSHGRPNFRVGGKPFAIYSLNHHGDGRVALLLRSPPGAQQLYTEMEAEHYFVPGYVGSKGWLGVELQSGLAWNTVATRTWEAWCEVAPPGLHGQAVTAPRVAAPSRPLAPEEIDRFLRPRSREILDALAERCSALPETSLVRQFGSPVWKAGKKSFVGGEFREGRLQLQFWVGAERQALLCNDPRYSIPPYIGGNGWINLDVEQHADWNEIQPLLLESYRHFALKRMLKAMGEI